MTGALAHELMATPWPGAVGRCGTPQFTTGTVGRLNQAPFVYWHPVPHLTAEYSYPSVRSAPRSSLSRRSDATAGPRRRSW